MRKIVVCACIALSLLGAVHGRAVAKPLSAAGEEQKLKEQDRLKLAEEAIAAAAAKEAEKNKKQGDASKGKK